MFTDVLSSQTSVRRKCVSFFVHLAMFGLLRDMVVVAQIILMIVSHAEVRGGVVKPKSSNPSSTANGALGLELLLAVFGWLSNYGPLLGPRNTGCRIILRTHKGTMILATTHLL